jgi:hypothetical protein
MFRSKPDRGNLTWSAKVNKKKREKKSARRGSAPPPGQLLSRERIRHARGVGPDTAEGGENRCAKGLCEDIGSVIGGPDPRA